MEPFLAQIMLFAGTFAPKGWLPCDGRELPIEHNEVLFSLVGTTYGGDGQKTFALPDLRGRAPVGVGEGSGVPALRLGDAGGAPSAAAGTGGKYNTGPYLSLGFYIAISGSYPRQGVVRTHCQSLAIPADSLGISAGPPGLPRFGVRDELREVAVARDGIVGAGADCDQPAKPPANVRRRHAKFVSNG